MSGRDEVDKRDTIRDPSARPHTLRGLNHGAPGAEEEPPSSGGAPVILPSVRSQAAPAPDAPSPDALSNVRSANAAEPPAPKKPKPPKAPRLLAKSATVPPAWLPRPLDESTQDLDARHQPGRDAPPCAAGGSQAKPNATSATPTVVIADATAAKRQSTEPTVITRGRPRNPSTEPTLVTQDKRSPNAIIIATLAAVLLGLGGLWLLLRAQDGVPSQPPVSPTHTKAPTSPRVESRSTAPKPAITSAAPSPGVAPTAKPTTSPPAVAAPKPQPALRPTVAPKPSQPAPKASDPYRRPF